MKKNLIIILASMILLCSCGLGSDIKSSSSLSEPSTTSSTSDPSSSASEIPPEEPQKPEPTTLDELIDIVKTDNPEVSFMYECQNDYIVGEHLGTFTKSFPVVEELEYIRGSRLVPNGIDYNDAFLRAKEIDKRLYAYLSLGNEINPRGTRIPDDITSKDDTRDKELGIFYRSVGAANLDGKPFYRVEVYYDTEDIFTDAYYVSADKDHNLIYLMSILDGTPILIYDSKEVRMELP